MAGWRDSAGPSGSEPGKDRCVGDENSPTSNQLAPRLMWRGDLKEEMWRPATGMPSPCLQSLSRLQPGLFGLQQFCLSLIP